MRAILNILAKIFSKKKIDEKMIWKPDEVDIKSLDLPTSGIYYDDISKTRIYIVPVGKLNTEEAKESLKKLMNDYSEEFKIPQQNNL
jgi:hypothetical protein